jgi:plasmid stabilization system protein ParE
MAEAAAEIERLRAALKAILDDPEIGTNVALYAKTALGDA